ncbi:hypothetical protein [Jiulongibacter sediminis]|uniref:hypothetical protein n=1 Tax=Jiulongibacter sediminis TaxID=1605367 RepID=UPI0006DD0FD5|nr:hypothetical protein [Jiulongibacter sediminis]
MKSLKYIGFSIMAAAVFSACSTSKTVVSNGEYDDLYGSSESARVVYSPTVSKKADSYAPDYLENYSDAYDRMPVDTTIDGTDAYYDENYISSRELNRNVSPDAGYSSGYADGYSEGWNDYAWNTPYSWNRFGYNNWNTWNTWNSWNALGYSPWGGGNMFFGAYGYVPLATRMALSYGYSPFGWSSPWGFNSFGMSPWGFSSYAYSPWGYRYGSYGMYGYGFNNFANGWSPYYGAQPVFASRAFNDTRFGTKRTYGPRIGGRSTSIYNDGFVNTRRPAATASSRRMSTGTQTATRGELTSRANGVVARSNRPTSYDSYTRRSSGNSMTRSGVNRTTSSGRAYSPASSGSSSYGRSTGTSSRTGTFNRTAVRSSGSATGSTFSRGNASNRTSGSYSPNSGSRDSGYSRPSTPSRSSGSYSSPSRGSSSGSYSRGSSGGSSSRSSGGSSGGSRGPR